MSPPGSPARCLRGAATLITLCLAKRHRFTECLGVSQRVSHRFGESHGESQSFCLTFYISLPISIDKSLYLSDAEP